MFHVYIVGSAPIKINPKYTIAFIFDVRHNYGE